MLAIVFQVCRMGTIESKQTTEQGFKMDISKSLFSLVKYNAGQFKSEKQKTFLSSFFVNGVYTKAVPLHFGEYDQKTERNTNTITFTFYLSECKGHLVKVTKSTKKRSSIYWELTCNSLKEAEQNKIKKEEAAKKAEILNNAINDYNRLLNLIDHQEKRIHKIVSVVVIDSKLDQFKRIVKIHNRLKTKLDIKKDELDRLF